MKESQASGPEILNSAIRRALLIEAQRQPKLSEDIHAVWVFGGAGTFFKPLIEDEESWQRWMDRQRIRAGVELVHALTAQKLQRSPVSLADIDRWGPLLVYNGNQKQNQDLRRALDSGKIKLPRLKVKVIEEVESAEGRRPIAVTYDQVASFYQEKARENSPLFGCYRIALVSHSPHFMRIPHYIRRFEEEFLQTHGRIISYWAYGVKSESAVFNEFVREELNKLTAYINCGHLSPHPTPHLAIA